MRRDERAEAEVHGSHRPALVIAIRIDVDPGRVCLAIGIRRRAMDRGVRDAELVRERAGDIVVTEELHAEVQ